MAKVRRKLKKNWRKVLGVRKNASYDEIEDAYLEACRKHHPELGGDGFMINEVSQAFTDYLKEYGEDV